MTLLYNDLVMRSYSLDILRITLKTFFMRCIVIGTISFAIYSVSAPAA